MSFKLKSHISGAALSTVAALLGLTAPAGYATAAVACADSFATIGNAGYLTCQGPISSGPLANPNGGAGETAALTTLFGGTWTWQGKSDDASNGPFTSAPSGTSGTISFDNPVKGLFIFAIKGGPDASYYEFNGGAGGISSLNWDTQGIAKGNGKPGPDISHLALYVGPVPEPETYAMMLAGLAGLGFIARRRKQA